MVTVKAKIFVILFTSLLSIPAKSERNQSNNNNSSVDQNIKAKKTL